MSYLASFFYRSGVIARSFESLGLDYELIETLNPNPNPNPYRSSSSTSSLCAIIILNLNFNNSETER
jgi:hypothetical protein